MTLSQIRIQCVCYMVRCCVFVTMSRIRRRTCVGVAYDVSICDGVTNTRVACALYYMVWCIRDTVTNTRTLCGLYGEVYTYS